MKSFAFSLAAGTLSGGKKTVAIGAAHTDVTAISQSTESPFTAELIYTDASELSKAGQPADVVLADGDITENLTATPDIPSYTIRAFLNWVKKYEPVITSITISSNNVNFYKRNMKIQRMSPSGNSPERYIKLKKAYSTQQFNDDKIVVDFEAMGERPVHFRKDLYWDLTIASDEEVSIDMNFMSESEKKEYLARVR